MRVSPLLLVASIALAACAAVPAPAKPVTVLISADAVELPVHTEVARLAEQARPGLRVELINVPGSGPHRARLAADFAAGTPPDVVLMNYQRLAPFAARDQFEPLAPFIARSSVFKESDFYAQASDPLRWNGQLLCVPFNASSPVFYVNKTLLSQAEQKMPTAGWTWDDFVRIGTAVRAARPAASGFAAEVSIARASSFVWGSGGAITDNTGRLALDSPAARAALQRWIDLRTKHGIAPDAIEDKAEDAQTRFANGRAAFFMDSRRAVPSLRTAIGNKFEWDVVALPLMGAPVAVLHSEAACMTRATSDKQAAWAYIETLTGAPGQTAFARIGRSVPALKSIATSSAFLDPAAAPANARAWLDNIPLIRPLPVHSNWPETEARINSELEGAFYGRQTLDQALAKLAPIADALKP
jgi:multiple sugar transport system substrate-binding protein